MMMPASVSDVGGLVLPPACQRPLAACQADSEPASHGETVSARLTVTAGRGTGPGGGSLRLSSTQPGFKLPAASHSDRDSCATPGATHRWQAAGSLGDSEALRLGPGLGLGPADSELQVTLPGTSSLRLEVTRLPLPACDSPELTTQ
jgi:hypothetical protein